MSDVPFPACVLSRAHWDLGDRGLSSPAREVGLGCGILRVVAVELRLVQVGRRRLGRGRRVHGKSICRTAISQVWTEIMQLSSATEQGYPRGSYHQVLPRRRY